MPFVVCLFFFKIIFFSLKILSGIPNSLDPGLIWDKTICKGYQQMTLVNRVKVGMVFGKEHEAPALRL